MIDTMLGKMLLISIALATSALVLGYAASGVWIGALLLLAWGLLWLLSRRRGWSWGGSLALALSVAAAVVGVRLEVGSGWMLLGVAAALSAWDVDHFERRLEGAGRVEDARALKRRHLRRLLIVDGLGLLVGAVALSVRTGFGFGPSLLLGLLAILGLSRAIGFLRHRSD